MTHLVLRERLHLTERHFMAEGDENRVITETPVTAWRPDEDSVDPAVERFDLSVIGPGDRQRACEMRGRGGVGLGRVDFAPCRR